MSKQRKMILIAAAVGVVSMFLPWWSVSIPFLGNQSVNGMHGSGVLVFICFMAAGVIAYLGDQSTNLNQTNWMIALISGGIAALVAVINFIDPPPLGNMSLGFYGALIAAIGIVASAFMYRSAGMNLQSGFDSLKGDVERRINSTTANSPSTNVTSTTVSHTPTDEPTRPTV